MTSPRVQYRTDRRPRLTWNLERWKSRETIAKEETRGVCTATQTRRWAIKSVATLNWPLGLWSWRQRDRSSPIPNVLVLWGLHHSPFSRMLGFMVDYVGCFWPPNSPASTQLDGSQLRSASSISVLGADWGLFVEFESCDTSFIDYDNLSTQRIAYSYNAILF